MGQGTIRDSMLVEILNEGLNEYVVWIIAKDENDNVLQTQVASFGIADEGSITVPATVLNFAQNDVVEKIEVAREEAGTNVLWDIEQQFNFTQAGTLTFSLTINLNTTSVTDGSFEPGADTYILGNGLAGKLITFEYNEQGNPATTNQPQGNMVGAGSIESSATEASIGLVDLSDTTGNVPADTDIDEIVISAPGQFLVSIQRQYNFEEPGTLTFTEFEFTVSV